MKKIIFLLFTLLIFGINITNGAPTVTNCPGGAPSNSDGTHNQYIGGGGVPGTCANHNFYNSSFTTANGSRADSVGENHTTSCGLNGFPYSFTQTATTVTVRCLIRDDIAPVAGDVTLTMANGSILYANNAQNTNIDVSVNGGAPIEFIQAQFEDSGSCASAYLGPVNSGSSPLINIFDISEVNVGCDSNANGSRNYSYRITEIRDEATNELAAASLNYFYEVYPNTDAPFSVNTVDNGVKALLEGDTYANNTSYDLNIELKDVYGNEIIPASGISRTINLTVNKDNEMYLNQYTAGGATSVFITDTNGDYTPSNLGLIADNLGLQISGNGFYPISFQVYTPTSNSTLGGTVSDSNAHYNISSIGLNIDNTGFPDIGLTVGNSNPINFKFNPAFTTTISGDIEDYGFLEGVYQYSDILVNSNIGAIPFDAYTKFSSGTTNDNNPDLNLSLSGSVLAGFRSLSAGVTAFSALADPYFNSTGLKNITTSLNISTGSTTDSITNSSFSTHFAYTLDGYNIVQNSDVIGKPSYFEVAAGSTTAGGVKVLGISSSTEEKSHDILSDQTLNDTHTFGELNKTILRKEIKKNAFTFTKNIMPSNDNAPIDLIYTIDNLSTQDWLTNIDGKKIYNDKVLYFAGNGGLVTLGDGSAELVEGNKTIIIEGFDLYIKDDMYYGDIKNDILGIIVLSDIDGNGGNIYIDPDVTNIVGIMYADKALVSADNTDGSNDIDATEELGGGLAQSVLANQLHIYGSVFSENTLGGSVNIVCPYYISVCTTKEEAQKYDLNYLRRYFVHSGEPINLGKVIGGGTCPGGVCGGGNNLFARVINNLADPLASYPVVIEYNPIIQTSPPPLFEK